MSLYLLAASARGLFIAMLIIMIVVSLLFGFIVFMALKPAKKAPEAVDANNVRKMLARRETQLTVELMNNKQDEAKRNELVNKLRRVKSAEQLVDELLEEEKAIVGATEAEEKERVKKPAAEKSGKPKNTQKPAKPEARCAPAQKKNDKEFTPSSDGEKQSAEKTE